MQTVLSHFPGLLKMSAQASVLIVLILAAQWICGRRLQPRWLWPCCWRLSEPLQELRSARRHNPNRQRWHNPLKAWLPVLAVAQNIKLLLIAPRVPAFVFVYTEELLSR